MEINKLKDLVNENEELINEQMELINKGEELVNRLASCEDISVSELIEFSEQVNKLNKKSEINFAVLIA